MMGIPFGVGLALFIDDLVPTQSGPQWSSAVPLVRRSG